MPITQDRMIALANAGWDYQQAYEQTWQSILDHQAEVAHGQETAEQALQALALYNSPKHRVANFNSAACIAVERQHFKSFRGKNNAAARWARRQRAGLTAELAREEVRSEEEPRPRITTPPPRSHQNEQKEKKPVIDPAKFDSALDAQGQLEGVTNSLTEGERAQLDSESEFLVRPGFTTPQALCGHARAGEGGTVCPECGKEIGGSL